MPDTTPTESAVPARAPTSARLQFIAQVLVAALLAVFALAPLGYAMWSRMPPRVATVDLQRIVEDDQARVVQSLGDNNALTPEARAALHQQTVDFARKLSLAIDHIGHECQCVLVNKAALLGGQSIDYTEQVRARMAP